MKTSGFHCKTKFGLLVFLGHPTLHVVTRCDINCVLMRETLFISQLHGEFQRGLLEPGRPPAKTRPDEIVESPIRWARRCKQDQELVNLTYNHIWQPSSRAINLGTTINSSIDNLLVGTMKNHENPPGTMKTQPGTMKDHPEPWKTNLEPWKTNLDPWSRP